MQRLDLLGVLLVVSFKAGALHGHFAVQVLETALVADLHVSAGMGNDEGDGGDCSFVRVA